MTRICRVCKQEKELEEFTKHKKMHLGYDTICKECNRIHARKWEIDNPEKYKLKCKRWYRANPDYVKKRNANRKEDISNFVLKYKEGKSCFICGYNKISGILEFHHKTRDDKNFNISEASSNHVGDETLMKEIEKCNLICPNCHREIHFNEWLENKEKNKPLY